MFRLRWFVCVGVLMCMASLAATPAQSELISRYSFTTDASDSISGFNGTLKNGATVSGGAVQFDGSDDYVDLPGNSLNVAGMTAVTFEAWGTYATDNSRWARLFDFGRTDNEGKGQNYVFLTPLSSYEGTPSVTAIGSAGDENKLDGSALTSGTTVHTVVVFDDVNDIMRYYINGSKVAEGTMSKTLANVSSEHAYLGKASFTADPYLKGSIDEFRVYNHALSDTDVAASYQRGPNSIPEPGVLALLASAMASLLAYAWRRRK